MAVTSSSGPGKFFATHPVSYVLALLGAGGAGVAFAARVRRASSARRLGWVVLALFEIAQFAGIAQARSVALRQVKHRIS